MECFLKNLVDTTENKKKNVYYMVNSNNTVAPFFIDVFLPGGVPEEEANKKCEGTLKKNFRLLNTLFYEPPSPGEPSLLKKFSSKAGRSGICKNCCAPPPRPFFFLIYLK